MFFRYARSLVLLIVVSLFWACGEAAPACTFDSDCGGGLVCVTQECVASCSSDADCNGPGETCQAYMRDGESHALHVCLDHVWDDAHSGGAPQCQSDLQCKELLNDDDAICGLNQTCVIPSNNPEPGASEPDEVDSSSASEDDSSTLEDADEMVQNNGAMEPDAPGVVDEEFHAVLIRDRIKRQDEGSDEASEEIPLGLELAALFMIDEHGDIVGFGDALDYHPASDYAFEQPHIDGRAPALDDQGQCMASELPREDNRTALGGEGGYLLAGFVDAQGARVMIQDLWSVVVIAWSDSCVGPDGSDAEAESSSEQGYEMYLCSYQEDHPLDALGQCGYSLGEYSTGYAEVVVRFDELSVQSDR